MLPSTPMLPSTTAERSALVAVGRTVRYVPLFLLAPARVDSRLPGVAARFPLQSFAHGYNPKRLPAFQDATHQRTRRMSHDEKGSAPRRFLIDVEETIRVVLEQEDTDGDFQISVTDAGPKLMALGTATSNGFKSFDIRVSN